MTSSVLYVGADIGRSTRVALVDDQGSIHRQTRVPTETKSARALVTGLIQVINQLKEQAHWPVQSVGIGLPGLVDYRTQHIEVLTNFVNISAINLFEELQRALNLPVLFDNDANMAAYAEWKCGAAKNANDVLYISLGRGIGSTLILGGQLQRGVKGFAGEFGHQKIGGTDTLECSCGAAGCLETVASGPNIVRRTREKLFTSPLFSQSILVDKMRGRLTCDDVVKAAIANDELSRMVLIETAGYLGTAVANAVNLLNVEKVILGGPVMAAGEFLLDFIRDEVSKQAFTPLFASCQIHIGQLGDDAGEIGAALMARDFTKGQAATK